LLKEKELPFLIEGNSPYKVTLGYTSKDNSFTKHEFTITYRLNNIITTNTTNPPENEVVPPQGDGDIVFEFTRTNEKNVNMTMEINVGDNPKKSEIGYTANNSHNFVALIKTDDQSRVDITGVGDFGSYDEKFKTIKGVDIKLVGNITAPRFTIDQIMTNEISLPLNYHDKFYFPKSGQYGVRFNEVRFDNLKNGEIGRIIIDLIY
ncbi:hypothetical protein, partial [Romboutsia ilealis]